MNNVVFIDPDYIRYRRMWKDDRWRVSSDLVKLTIKQGKGELTEEETRRLNAINRIVEEHDGQWLEGIGGNQKLIKKIR